MRRVMAWLLATWLLAWRDEPDVYDEVHGDVVIVPMVSRPFADSEGGRNV